MNSSSVGVAPSIWQRHISAAKLNSSDLQNKSFFGKGSSNSKSFWNSLICQASISGFIKKNIENYGVIKLRDKGYEYLIKQITFCIYLDKKKEKMIDNISQNPLNNDINLRNILLELRKKVADTNKVPPYTVFQDVMWFLYKFFFSFLL